VCRSDARPRIRLADTPDGRRLVVSRAVDAPAARVRTILRDTERWPAWGPSVAAVDCADRLVREGSTGRVRIAGLGLWAPFVVTTCRDRRWSWDVAGVPATGHVVEPLPDGRARVGIEVPPLAAPYAAVCGVALDRIASLAVADGRPDEAGDADGGSTAGDGAATGDDARGSADADASGGTDDAN
jgi:hypothetical protein